MTPLIVPGVDASPLMTWGDIEGTPRMLDPLATPGLYLLSYDAYGTVSHALALECSAP